MVSDSEHYFGDFGDRICCLCLGLRLFSFSAHLITWPVNPYSWVGSASAHVLWIKCSVLCPTCSTLRITTFRFSDQGIFRFKVTVFSTLLRRLLAPGTKYCHECLPKVSNKPVNGKVKGGVDNLQKLDTCHCIQVPDWSDALKWHND